MLNELQGGTAVVARSRGIQLRGLCSYVALAALGAACSPDKSDHAMPEMAAPVVQDVSFLEGCWFHQGGDVATTSTIELLPSSARPEVYAGDLKRMSWGHVEGAFHFAFAVDGSWYAVGRTDKTNLNGEYEALPHAYLPVSTEAAQFLAPGPKRATFERSGAFAFVAERDGETLALYTVLRNGRVAYLFTGVRTECS
jgi:hypothetical protein